MARFSGIQESERLDLMLEYVRESEEATLLTGDTADVLDCGIAVLSAKDLE
jgi:hypothetical protein